jgi:DNA polymerase-3 subunit delta
MQVRLEQLEEQLARQLAPVYLLSGDEPLQIMEAAEKIRKVAKQQGFIEREVWVADAQFDWANLNSAGDALSLFASQKLLDVRLANCKLNQTASKALQHYLERLPSDKVLILQATRLDKVCKNSAWVKKIEQVGVAVQVWDLSPAQTIAWVAKRMRNAGLQASDDAIRYLAERIEGNLLAAAQEITKLQLLYAQQRIEVSDIQAVVADSARFTVFDLVDAVLSQDSQRLQHILHILQEENTALTLVVWTLSDLLRQLYSGSLNLQTGQSNQDLLLRMPKLRQGLFLKLLNQHRSTQWPVLFQQAAQLDQLSKGVGLMEGNAQRVWDQLLLLALALANKTLFDPTT